ncbi:MAG: hypothetical protein KGS61_16405, partial [Verrucomicrobia bacterium]|nr:hypothetical protein [Verrucomicrobiota bacterium]
MKCVSPFRLLSLILCGGIDLLFPTHTRAADVQFYLVQKRAAYTQTGSGTPGLNGSTPYRFEADVIATSLGAVNSATLQVPGGAVETLSSQTGSTQFQFKSNFATAAALDTAFTAGSYVYAISTAHDGLKNALSLALPPDNFPAAPVVSNFGAAQAVNAAADFTLTWGSFSGGTTNDLIEVEVDDATTFQTVFSTPYPGSPGVLNGTAVSVVIPAGTLTTNRSYQVNLTFDKITSFDQASYPGAIGVVLFAARTSLTLVTGAGAASGPDVTAFRVAKGQMFIQTGAGAPGLEGAAPYVFRAGANLSTTSAASGSVQLPNNGAAKPLTADGDSLKLVEAYASQSGLDSADPDGTYTVTFNTVHDGIKTIPLNLAGDLYPTTPQISNYSAGQAINAGADFTVSWGAFAGGSVSDSISLIIQDAAGNDVFSTGDPGSPGGLNGTATSVVIPAGRLQAGQVYQAQLIFVKATSVDTT